MTDGSQVNPTIREMTTPESRSADVTVRRLHPSELDRVKPLLVRAFHDDPLMQYAAPNETRRRKVILWLYSHNVQYGLQYGEVYTTDDLNAVAVWLPPGHSALTLHGLLRTGYALAPFKLGWRAFIRIVRYSMVKNRLHKRCGRARHWYLFLIAVDPAVQGRGVGEKLLQPILDKADAERATCFLETTNGRSLQFFKRLGFIPCDQHKVRHTTLKIWAARREPGASN